MKKTLIAMFALLGLFAWTGGQCFVVDGNRFQTDFDDDFNDDDIDFDDDDFDFDDDFNDDDVDFDDDDFF